MHNSSWGMEMQFDAIMKCNDFFVWPLAAQQLLDALQGFLSKIAAQSVLLNISEWPLFRNKLLLK